MQTVLHITDCHLVEDGATLLGVDTQASLEAVLAQALQQSREKQGCDLLVASGDLVHGGSVEIYQRFLLTIRRFFDAPLLCLPGNHDLIENMHLAHLPMQGLTLGSWLVAPLDSHIDNEPSAHVGPDDLQALKQAINASRAAHLLLATHHPMVEINTPWLDKDRIFSIDEVMNVISNSFGAKLRGAIFGHAHQEVEMESENGPLLGTPSTCFQFLPKSPKFAVDQKAPGYRWLFLEADGGLTSKLERLTTLSFKPTMK
jgi:Icc protein